MTEEKCRAKDELEKILNADYISALDISDLLKAHQYGCLNCNGKNKLCGYYRGTYLEEK